MQTHDIVHSNDLSRIATVLIACLVLTACGSGENQPAPAPPTPAKAPAKVNKPLDSRVKAVAAEPGAQPFGLEFELLNRPAVNEPVEIKLYLLGLTDAVDLNLTVKPSDKLQLVAGAEAKFPMLKSGETLEHAFKVLSDAPGMMIADVQLQASVAGQPKALTFSVPLAFSAPQ